MKKSISDIPYLHPKGTQIWACSHDTPEVIETCKQWVKDNGYTSEDVKIVRTEDNMVLVVMK